MNAVNKRFLITWLVVSLVLLLFGLFSAPVEGSDKSYVDSKGYIVDPPETPARSTTRRVRRQTGTINGKTVNLKTVTTENGTVTTGYIDGKYVRIKEKSN